MIQETIVIYKLYSIFSGCLAKYVCLCVYAETLQFNLEFMNAVVLVFHVVEMVMGIKGNV